jgi:O-antigen/teichoic acid export membrane protein
LKNRLIKGAVGSFGLKIAGTGLTFAKSIMFARLLGTEGFGTFAYAITWISLLSIPAKLGLPPLLVREFAIYQTQSSWGLMRGLLRWSNQVVLFISTGLALIAAGVARNLEIGTDSQILLVFYIALVSLPIVCLTNLRLSAMQGLHKVVLGQSPEALIAPLLLMIFTGFGYLIFREDLSVYFVMAMHVSAISITFLIGVFLLREVLPEAVKDIAPEYQSSKWLRSGLPLMFLGGLQLINTRTDVLMLGAIQGVEAVGIYVVVNRLSSLIVFILMAVNSVLAPTAARLYAEGKIQQLQRVVTKSSRVVFLISLPVAGVLILLGHWLLLLFGSDFTQGQIALIVLSLGQLVNAGMGSVNLLLNMTGHENYTAISVGAGAVLNVALNALLIPQWGLEGAAVATAISMIFWNIMSLVWVKKALGINSTAIGKF